MSLLSRLAVQAARAYGLFAKKGGITANFLVVAGGGGGGGAINASPYYYRGSSGSDSSISGTGLTTLTSTGGGGGGTYLLNAYSGGSGGGGGASGSSAGSGTANQGYAGGAGKFATDYAGGGGGGAGAVGVDASGSGATLKAGNGGAGVASSISGSSVTYAGGGGGAGTNTGGQGTGGSGGGGNGAKGSNGSAGTTNTGGGGGGGDFGGGAGDGGGGAGGFRTSAGTSGGGASAESTISLSTLNTYSIVVGAGGNGGGTGATGTGGNGGSGIVIISYASATPLFIGGTITTSGGNQIHTFTSSGTLTPVTQVSASYLVVAGGGGSAGDRSGGGGAGGLLSGSTTLYSPATYIVTVGAGGAGGSGASNATSAQDGSNSVLSGTGLTTLTATGGGGGNGAGGAGRNGGSGGGGGGNGSTSTSGGTGTSGQGTNGGNGLSTSGGGAGGGGGGATSAGANATSNVGGNGGAGTSSSISGSSVTYAGGGGGGGATTGGTGGSGGGGNGAGGSPATQLRGVSGTTNTGGGGGGGSNYSTTSVTQASGGSGVVIISYAGSQVFNGGTITTSGGNTIHTFYATGALTPITNNLTNSLRFRSSASAYLSRTPSVAGNQQKWTYSLWLKRGALSTVQNLLVIGSNVTGQQSTQFGLNNDNTIQFFDGLAGVSTSILFDTTQVFRDPSAWYHIVLSVDTTQSTSTNRVKIYINGNQITAFTSSTYPTQNFNTLVNAASTHYIGRFSNVSTNYFDGYLSDVYLIDGQALEPYYFGSNDENNIWKPIKYYGMYGTNGFHLDFTNTTSTTTIGYDSSPNGNNWTTNNISLTAGTTYDAMTDVPTNTSATQANYCVLNPLDIGNLASLSNANLTFTQTGTGYSGCRASIGITSGKWYWEITVGGTNASIGIATSQANLKDSAGTAAGVLGYDAYGWAYIEGGQKYNSNSATSYGASYTTNDIIGVAFDADAGTLTFYKNNTSQGTAFTGLTNGPYFPAISDDAGGSGTTLNANFGQRPFTYTAPSGYVALNTYNLSTPTIIQGNKYMDATLYTGNGVTQTIVNASQFKPDLVWTKARSNTDTNSNTLVNSNVGRVGSLSSNQTSVEGTSPANYDLVSFNSNGFTVGPASQADMNTNGWTFVGWQWQAGQGTNTSNTSGSITSTVSVNTTAGFSVVTYTGTGANATVGHGLGVAPKMIIVKSRTTAGDEWCVWHTSLTNATYYLYLNGTGAQAVATTFWNSTAPTSSVINLGTDVRTNRSSGNFVCYAFAEIAGFSKFGSYTGNGSADGPFTYLGFRPKFIMIKSSSVGGAGYYWVMYDSSRNTYNVADLQLCANLSDAEAVSNQIDLLSNGFKVFGAGTRMNGSGTTYIYMAFAENPTKYANAR